MYFNRNDVTVQDPTFVLSVIKEKLHANENDSRGALAEAKAKTFQISAQDG